VYTRKKTTLLLFFRVYTLTHEHTHARSRFPCRVLCLRFVRVCLTYDCELQACTQPRVALRAAVSSKQRSPALRMTATMQPDVAVPAGMEAPPRYALTSEDPTHSSRASSHLRAHAYFAFLPRKKQPLKSKRVGDAQVRHQGGGAKDQRRTHVRPGWFQSGPTFCNVRTVCR
jgi:hypothetical protein